MVLWNYPYLIFLRHCFTQKILIFISGPYKAVLGIYTRKNKIKFQCKGLLTSLATVKNEIWEKQENWPWWFKKKIKEQEYWTTSECSCTCWKYISICYNLNIHIFLHIFQVTSTLCNILSSILYSKNTSRLISSRIACF